MRRGPPGSVVFCLLSVVLSWRWWCVHCVRKPVLDRWPIRPHLARHPRRPFLPTRARLPNPHVNVVQGSPNHQDPLHAPADGDHRWRRAAPVARGSAWVLRHGDVRLVVRDIWPRPGVPDGQRLPCDGCRTNKLAPTSRTENGPATEQRALGRLHSPAHTMQLPWAQRGHCTMEKAKAKEERGEQRRRERRRRVGGARTTTWR